ncbi:glycosyltransferase [Acrocarpospora corrugata]
MVGIPAVSHVLPSLEVVRELVARGHRVTYANDPAVAELVGDTGATLVPYRSTLPVADDAWPEDPIEAMGVFLDDNIQVLPQLRRVYEADPADLYMYDIGSYAARALAEAQGRPAVQLSPTYVAWEGYDEEVGAQLWQLPGAAEYRAKFAKWLAECGAVTTDVDAFPGRPARALALVPEAMQPNAERVDRDVVTFVGPCFGERNDQGRWEKPPGAEKVLLISLGTSYTRQPEFYRQCLKAFGGLPGWHVVLQVGKQTDIGELGEIPGNFEIHRWVPQLAILRQATAFVTHAGMGGSSEGLYTGLPMIAVPQAVDQFANADRLVELGVARRFDTADATAAALRKALLELTGDPDVAQRSRRSRAAAMTEGGTPRAADLIEAMLP